MKLYTEEQVSKAIELARTDDVYYPTKDEIVNALTPIKLPSDEDIGVIALNIAETLKDKLDSREEAFYLAGFQTCAKWVIEKIKQQAEVK